MPFAGVDISQFPGLDTMAWLKANTNLAFSGFYLGPAPSHHDDGWMTNRAALAAQGWGLAPIYVGQQVIGPGSHQANASQGAHDSQDAARLMVRAGFPLGSCVYLDLENGPPMPVNQADYVQAWAQGVRAAGLTAGVYCSHLLADDTAFSGMRLWVFRVQTVTDHAVIGTQFPAPDPIGSGSPLALVWQREQNAEIDADGRTLLVDLNTSVVHDPGAP